MSELTAPMTVTTSIGIADDDLVSSMSKDGQCIDGVAEGQRSNTMTSRSPRTKKEKDKMVQTLPELSPRVKTSPRSLPPWHDRHHVTNSKDNMRLPRKKRDYFDSLPSVRVSSGVYHEVPKHFAVSLDIFKGTSWTDQKMQLETRFALYPHRLQPLDKEPSKPSAEPTSPDKKPDKEEEAVHDQNFAENQSSAPRSSKKNSNAPAFETAPTLPPVPMKVLLAALPDGGHRISKASSMRERNIASPNSPRIERQKTREVTLQEELMAASGSASASQDLQKFMKWCKKNFGSLSACWRSIDESGNMTISRNEFFKKMVELRYKGNVKSLWEMLDRDHSNTISFLHFDPESAMMLAVLKRWATEQYGSVEKLCEAVDVNRTGKVTFKAFHHYCKTRGLEEEKPVHTIFKMCGNQSVNKIHRNVQRSGEEQTITLSSLTFLDRWECPEYLWIAPDEEGLNLWRGKLMSKYKGNGIIAWRKVLDADESMRVNWLEFKTACKHFKEEIDVPGVWRALDGNLSGWLSLREFDPQGYELLAKFKNFAQSKFGTCQNLIQSMDTKGAGEISRAAFKATLKRAGVFNPVLEDLPPEKYPDDSQSPKSTTEQEDQEDKVSERRKSYKLQKSQRRLSALEVEEEDIDHVFSGLDIDGSGLIRPHEVRFLDRWDIARELAEEAVWERLMKARWQTLTGASHSDLTQLQEVEKTVATASSPSLRLQRLQTVKL